jgi:CheY-like chemotaxis protein
MEKILNILLVDDDLISNAVTSNTLKKLPISYDLKVFLNVNDIIQYIEEAIFDKNKIDIIFIDLNFPNQPLQGWELIENIQNNYITNLSENVKIYILSSSTSKIDIERAKKYSFVRGFINKPITKEVLKKIF